MSTVCAVDTLIDFLTATLDATELHMYSTCQLLSLNKFHPSRGSEPMFPVTEERKQITFQTADPGYSASQPLYRHSTIIRINRIVVALPSFLSSMIADCRRWY